MFGGRWFQSMLISTDNFGRPTFCIILVHFILFTSLLHAQVTTHSCSFKYNAQVHLKICIFSKQNWISQCLFFPFRFGIRNCIYSWVLQPPITCIMLSTSHFYFLVWFSSPFHFHSYFLTQEKATRSSLVENTKS